MKICFDLRPLQIGHQNRGIGMHIRSILENLPNDRNSYIFYCFEKDNPIESLGLKINYEYQIVQSPTLKTTLDSPKDIINFIKVQNHSFKRLKKYRPDIFIQFDFTLGAPRWRKTKNIAFAYDLIPLVLSNDYLPTARFAWNNSYGKKSKALAVARALYYRFKLFAGYRLYKRAHKVISISEATRKSFVSLLKVDPSKIITIPLAPVFSDDKPDVSVLNKIKAPYILYIGGSDPRKNIDHLVYVFNIARGRGLNASLVLAGSEFNKVEEIPSIKGRDAILASPYRKDIILLGFISDAEKLALYQNALVFLFLSSYEGYGLPIIEATSCGCTVMAYDNSSIPEVSTRNTLLVENGRYENAAKKLTIKYQRTHQQVVKNIPERTTRWSDYTIRLIEAVK